MAAVMSMPTDQYCRWLQATTADMFETAPTGPGIVPAQLRHMAEYRTEYPTATPPHAPPTPARSATPPDVVRAMVQAKRAEMATEREGREVRRRVRNEIARDFEYVRQNPNPDGYSATLARLHGAEPELDIYQHGPVPDPYTLDLGGEIVPRRADGTPVRLPEGDDPPDGYTLALEARRSSHREANDN